MDSSEHPRDGNVLIKQAYTRLETQMAWPQPAQWPHRAQDVGSRAWGPGHSPGRRPTAGRPGRRPRMQAQDAGPRTRGSGHGAQDTAQDVSPGCRPRTRAHSWEARAGDHPCEGHHGLLSEERGGEREKKKETNFGNGKQLQTNFHKKGRKLPAFNRFYLGKNLPFIFL